MNRALTFGSRLELRLTILRKTESSAAASADMPDSSVIGGFPVYPGQHVGKAANKAFVDAMEIFIDSHADLEALDRGGVPPGVLGWAIIDPGGSGFTSCRLINADN